jgi:hypothetical protein
MAQTKILLSLKKYIDGHIERLHSLIDTLELKHGRDGKDGLDGKDGKDGLNGLNGLDGVDGKDGKDGKQGKAGKKGKDGVSVVDAKIDVDNHLVLTLSDDNEIDAGSLESLTEMSEPSVYRTSTRVIQSTKTWVDYAYNWTAEPVSLGAVSGGEKFEYTFLDGTLYRFVPSPYVPTEDSFYRDVNLTDKVISRGGSI